MSNPHPMEINCKYEKQIELATDVSNGGLWASTCTESVNYDTY